MPYRSHTRDRTFPGDQMTSVRIICLHRVVPNAERERYWPWLLRGSAITDRDMFDGLVRMSASHDFVDEQEAWELLRGDDTPARPACWVTFDDGYRDNLEIASPILARFGIRPSLFVTTAMLGTDFLLPVDRWYLTLLSARRTTGVVDFREGQAHFDLSHTLGRRRAVSGPEKRHYVMACDDTQKDMLQRLSAALDASDFSADLRLRARGLSINDLAALCDRGWWIGHHGQSHRRLPLLADAEFRRELVEPAEFLDRLQISRSRCMAWPDGAWTREAVCRAATLLEPFGYRGGLSIEQRVASRVDCSWTLPRFLAL